MVEKMFDFHQNSFADNMVVEVAHKTVDNMDYNVEATESEAHIAAEVVHIADNMNYNVQAVESRVHIADNMNYNVQAVESRVHIAAKAAHIVDNMNYNVEAVESRVHIAVKVVYKTVKIAANMAHNEYRNCKFVQVIFVPF